MAATKKKSGLTPDAVTNWLGVFLVFGIIVTMFLYLIVWIDTFLEYPLVFGIAWTVAISLAVALVKGKWTLFYKAGNKAIEQVDKLKK